MTLQPVLQTSQNTNNYLENKLLLVKPDIGKLYRCGSISLCLDNFEENILAIFVNMTYKASYY